MDDVIVHKVDRLAHNCADDANLTMHIYRHEAKLISCSESIDDTPSGKLVHGIMAAINEWYSVNLGTEAAKGMLQKAKQGGTPGRAAVGYRDIVDTADGREVRNVVVDPEAGPCVQWAFKEFATGIYSLVELTEGFGSFRAATMLRNHCCLGIVTVKDIEYPGKHESLIEADNFQAVGDILDERANSRQKTRTYRHYLTGSLYCRRYECLLCFTRSAGKSEAKFDCFLSTGCREGACDKSYLGVPEIEEGVVRLYHEIQLPEDLVEIVRA